VTEKLYTISVPGADEIHAAPSLKVAEIMKEKHDATMKSWLEEHHAKNSLKWVALDDVLAVVEVFDGEKEEHAELLAEFSFADWGITEADLKAKDEQEDLMQGKLFEGDLA
jgi:hypothetical protein